MTTVLNAPRAGGEAMLALARSLAAEFAPGAVVRDRERQLPHAQLDRVRETRLHAARVPARYGGPGIGFVELTEIMIILARADSSIAQALLPHQVFIDTVQLEASEEQRAKIFAGILGGEIISNAFAERGGKFVGDISTRLTADGNRFRLHGTKAYSTGSLFSQKLYCLALNECGERVLALVPVTREGVTIEDDWDGMGQRTTASNTVRLNQVAVAPDEVIHLQFWGKRRSYIGASAQIMHAAIDAGIAFAALDDALAFGRKGARPMPEAHVERASDDPYVQQAIGEMAVAAHQAEAMVYRAARILDVAAAAQAGNTVSPGALDRLLSESSIAVAEAKASAEASSLRVSESLYRVGGASATVGTLNFDRHWRNARTHTTHDPVAYKYKAVGDYFLNDTLPPITTKI